MKAVNLIPSEQRSDGAVGTRSGGAAFLVLGLLAGLVVLAGLYGMAHKTLQSRTAEAATIARRAEAVKQQAAALAPYASFMSLREERLHSIAELVGGRFDWPSVMDELSRVLPDSVSLSSIQGTVGASATSLGASTPAPSAAAVASSTPPGATPAITLSGCATGQSVVAEMLVRLRLINGVNNVTLQSSTKSGTGSSSGNCGSNDPVFSIQVGFEPLPTASTPSIQQLTSNGTSSTHSSGGSSGSQSNASSTSGKNAATGGRANAADKGGLPR